MLDTAAIAGREKEFAQLNGFLWQAIAGQGKVVFVTGGADTGSRAFVENALRQAQMMHPSLTVAVGECRRDGETYLPFTEIMRLLTGEVGGELADNAISGTNSERLRATLHASGAALAEIGPDILDVFVDGSSVLANAALFVAGNVPWLDKLRRQHETRPQLDQERVQQGRLFEAYSDVLIAVARQQPLALVLLDLQWADQGTLDLLFHLTRRIREVPLLVLGTYRPDEVAAGREGPSHPGRHPLEPIVNEVVRYYGPITIPLDTPDQPTGSKPTQAPPSAGQQLAQRVSRPRPEPVEQPPTPTELVAQAVPYAEERTVFVGREEELAQLRSFLDATLHGSGQVLFVTGEPGAGKSTLVEEFAYRAQQEQADVVVAVGDCNAQTGAADAYLPFREILSMLTGDIEGKLADQAISQENATRLQGLLRWSGKALVELGPDLIDVFVPGSGVLIKGTTLLAEKVGWTDKLGGMLHRKQEMADPTAGGIEQSHLFEQYTNVICTLADRNPLILILDDLQWADEASIALLFHLGRRIMDRRVLVIGTYRPNDVAMGRDGERHPLEPIVAELKRYYADIEIHLGTKTDLETRVQFVSHYIDQAYAPHRLDADFKKLIFKRTEGHALFVVELLRDLVDRGTLALDDQGDWYLAQPVRFQDLPARVDAVIGERIGRLDAELREILTCASVEGEDFTAQVVARVQQINERQLARQLAQELDKQHHLVNEEGVERVGRNRLFLWRFQHALFQDRLYRDLSEMERVMLHEDVARTLEDLYADAPEKIAVQLARHFLEAEVFDKAFEYLVVAGERARVQFANEEAIGYFETALEVADELPPETADDVAPRLIEVHEHLADVLVNVGAYEQALKHYTLALDGALHDLDEQSAATASSEYAEHAAAIQRQMARVQRLKGDYKAALTWLSKARTLLVDESNAELARICIAEAQVRYRLGEAREALGWCERGLDIASEMNTRIDLAHAYMLRGTILGDLGKLEQAIEDSLASLEICHEIGDALGEAKAHNGLGVHYYYTGDWEKSIKHYQASLEIRQRIGDVTGTATVSNNLGELYLIQGQFDEAVSAFQTCLETWGRTGFQLGVALSHRNLAQVYMKRRDWELAAEQLEMSLQVLDEMGSTDWLLAEVYRHLAEVRLGLGRHEGAWRFAERALNIAQIQGVKLVEGNARCVMGQVYRSQGEWDKAEKSFESALELLEAQEMPYEVGQVLRELAIVYRERGSQADAAKLADTLDRATGIFEKLGAAWDLAEVQALRPA